VSLVVTIGPTIDPVTTADAKAHLRVTGSTEDAYISSLITVAALRVQAMTRRTLINTTYLWTTDALFDEMRLPVGPVSALGAITLYDEADAPTVVSSSVYRLSQELLVVKKRNEDWPDVDLRNSDPVTVAFTSGYGAATTDLPEPLVHAVKLLLSHWFENREPVVLGTIVSAIPQTVDALVGPYVRYSL
jgi:uncharacterized phiE125 gp8 family phage protein